MNATLVYYVGNKFPEVKYFRKTTESRVVNFIRKNQIPMSMIKVITFERDGKERSYSTDADISKFVTGTLILN